MAPFDGHFRISTLNGAITRVSVVGELDLAAAPRLLTLLEELVRSGHTTLLVDLTEVTFLDSSGLAILLRTHQQLQRSSGRLAVLCPDARKRHLFELVGHNLIFPVEGTLTAAAARLPAAAP